MIPDQPGTVPRPKKHNFHAKNSVFLIKNSRSRASVGGALGDRGCHVRCYVTTGYIVICLVLFRHVTNNLENLISKGECFAPLCPESIRAVIQVTLTPARRVSLAVTWLTVYRQLKIIRNTHPSMPGQLQMYSEIWDRFFEKVEFFYH